MSINPFATVSDYPSMLNKIAFFIFVASLGAVALLRFEICALNEFLNKFNLQITLGIGFELPMGTVAPAFLYAILSRITKLHDRLSDLLAIRKRFDVSHILQPLAILSHSTIKLDRIWKFHEERKNLMYSVFYKYASSSPNKAQIESHYITMALDQWSWYWIILEATFLSTLTAMILVLFSPNSITAFYLLCFTLLAMGLLQLVQLQCRKYAYQQSEQIIADPKRKQDVRDVFNAL